MLEIVRAAIPRICRAGQLWKGARALSACRPFQAMRHVVAPQILRAPGASVHQHDAGR